jgi:hypothetical protein
MTNGEKIQTILDVDRDCTEVHGDNGTMTFTVTLDFWNAEYKEPSSSGKPNKSIEEKCPCYYCEHFEIKGLSHCKIHEDTYGDSRCNDYHKINQKPNKSEIPTGSTTKNDLGVDCISRQELLKIYEDRFSELQKLKHLKDNKGAEDRQMGINYCINILKELPPVTPQEPRWIPCSEKKPDKGGEYLLWGKIDESEEENYCFIGDYHEFDEVFGVEISKYDSKTLGFIDTEIEEYYSVVAWIPLPQSYKEVRKNDT